MARVQLADVVQRVAAGYLRPVEAATVQVNVHGGGAATLYADDATGALVANPLRTDENGLFSCYVEEGSYDVVVDGAGPRRVEAFLAGATGSLALRSRWPANVKDFGAVGDGVTDDHTAITAAIATGRPVYLPAGTYKLGDGKTLVPQSFQLIFGDGAQRTFVNSKNAYCFSVTAGSTSEIGLKGMSLDLRAGSVSGGAAQFRSGGYHSGVRISDCLATGLPAVATPVWDCDGFIGSKIRDTQGNGGQVGIGISGDTFIANANLLQGVRTASNTVCGIFDSGGLTTIKDSISESNTGWGLIATGAVNGVYESIHFENNVGHIKLDGTSRMTVRGNGFYYHGSGVNAHVEITGVGRGNRIFGNNMQDPAGGQYAIKVGAAGQDNLVAFNYQIFKDGAGVAGFEFSDAGTRTRKWMNWNNGGETPVNSIQGAVTLGSIAAASVPNNSFFRDSADDKLKFKDNAGVVNLLY